MGKKNHTGRSRCGFFLPIKDQILASAKESGQGDKAEGQESRFRNAVDPNVDAVNEDLFAAAPPAMVVSDGIDRAGDVVGIAEGMVRGVFEVVAADGAEADALVAGVDAAGP